MTLHHTINKTMGCVFDYLTDMQKFVSVHPVITKIEKIAGNNYRVFETLKIAFIPCSFTYTVMAESEPQNNKVIMYATVMRLTKVTMVFILKAGQGFTFVEEEISFTSPLPVVPVLTRIFTRQHKQLFKNIEMAG